MMHNIEEYEAKQIISGIKIIYIYIYTAPIFFNTAKTIQTTMSPLTHRSQNLITRVSYFYEYK